MQLCIKSWDLYGDFDQVDILDAASVYNFLPPGTLPSTYQSLPVQIQSDLVRLGLLREYGGIWMDASTLVTSPVASWLGSLELNTESFLFQNTGAGIGGRLFETGFMASRPNHEFFSDWFNSMRALFSRHRIHRAHSPASSAPLFAKKLFAFLNKYLRQSARLSAFWVVPPLSWLPFYPFFIVHYAGNALLRQSKHSTQLSNMETVLASRYLRIRDVSNKLGWPEALKSPLLFDVPVHDVEFRKSLTDEELSALREFVEAKQ